MNNIQLLIIIFMAVLATLVTRFLPFILSKQLIHSRIFSKLSEMLPYGSIALLVVYSLKETSFTSSPFGLYEAVGVFVVTLLQLTKSNALLSIAVGTFVYIFLLSF